MQSRQGQAHLWILLVVAWLSVAASAWLAPRGEPATTDEFAKTDPSGYTVFRKFQPDARIEDSTEFDIVPNRPEGSLIGALTMGSLPLLNAHRYEACVMLVGARDVFDTWDTKAGEDYITSSASQILDRLDKSSIPCVICGVPSLAGASQLPGDAELPFAFVNGYMQVIDLRLAELARRRAAAFVAPVDASDPRRDAAALATRLAAALHSAGYEGGRILLVLDPACYGLRDHAAAWLLAPLRQALELPR